MANLFTGFFVEKYVACESRKSSDGIVFVYCIAWCVRGLKSLKWYWPYLIKLSGDASWMVSLSNYCMYCYLFFISNLMMSSVVYAHLYDLRQWSDRVSVFSDIGLQNFKKPLDIFSSQIERKRSKEYLVIILAVKESFERFSCLEFIFEKKQTPGTRLKHKLIKTLSLKNQDF